MKSAIKKTLLTAFALIFALCVFVGINAHGVMATDADNTDTFIMHDGASARPADGVNGAGMRFAAEISAEQYGNLKKKYGDKLEFGIILSTQDWIDSNGLEENFKIGGSGWSEYTVDTTADYYYLRGRVNPAADKNDLDKDGDTTEMLIMFAITDIYEANFSRAFVAKAYYTTDGENYVYTKAAKRSLFTVASKAIAGGWLDENTEAKTYFNGVIDTVLTTYNQVEVEVTGVDAQTKVGDKIGVTAYVSNGTKRLEAAATVTCDVDGMLTANSDGSYTINKIGDFNLTAEVASATKSVKIDNAETYYLDMANDLSLATADSLMTYTKNTSAAGGRENTYAYVATAATSNQDQVRAGKLNFSSKANNVISAGDYVLFDMYIPAGEVARFMLGIFTDDAIQMYAKSSNNYTSSGGQVRVYVAGDNGVKEDAPTAWDSANSAYRQIWYTVAVKTTKAGSIDGTMFNVRYNPYGAGQSLYFDNFRIAKELPIEQSELNVVYNAGISDLSSINSTISSIETVTSAVGGRADVIKYTSGAGESKVRFVGGTGKAPASMRSGKYLSFDVYMESAVELGIRIQATVDGSSSYKHYVLDFSKALASSAYQVDADGNVGIVASGTVFFNYELYRADGTKVDVTAHGANEYLNEWLTVKIIFVGDYNTCWAHNNSEWTAFYYKGLSGNQTATAYLSNMFIAETSEEKTLTKF